MVLMGIIVFHERCLLKLTPGVQSETHWSTRYRAYNGATDMHSVEESGRYSLQYPLT